MAQHVLEGAAMLVGVVLATAGAALEATAPGGDVVGSIMSTGGGAVLAGVLGYRLVDVLGRLAAGVEQIGAALGKGVTIDHRHGGDLVEVVRGIGRRDPPADRAESADCNDGRRGIDK
jgi:hypothetical protein